MTSLRSNTDTSPPPTARSPISRRNFITMLSLAAAIPTAAFAITKKAASSLPNIASFKTSQGAVLLKLKADASLPPIYLGKFEVSVREVLAFYRATGHNAEKQLLWSNPVQLNLPATCTFLECISFLAWLTEVDHDKGNLPANWAYTLPDDLSWTIMAGGTLLEDRAISPKERAAKPRESTYLWLKPEPVAPINVNVVHGGDYPTPPAGAFVGADGAPGLCPVDHLDISPQGFVGCVGNASEWCIENFAGGNDWDPLAMEKTVRGANFLSTDPNACRLAHRFGATRDLSGASAPLAGTIGFRICAREIKTTPSSNH